MKKRTFALIFLSLALIFAIFFFPVAKTYSLSGTGLELTTDKEKIGTCELSIEITEVRSLVMNHGKTFSFVLNGEEGPGFVGDASCSETEDGLCAITGMYYDARRNRMAGCGVIYDKDLTYAVLHWNDRSYFLPNGTEMPYSQIPWEIGTGDQDRLDK